MASNTCVIPPVGNGSVPSPSVRQAAMDTPAGSRMRSRRYSWGERPRDASFIASTAPKTCNGMPP